jgi:hypothetical protein
MALNGYTKPIYALEFTGSIPIWLRNRGGHSVYAPHFPYAAEFAARPFFDEPLHIGVDGAGPYDGDFSVSSFTGLSSNYAVAVRIVDLLPAGSPNKFIWTKQYNGDGLPNGMVGAGGTQWYGPLTMTGEAQELTVGDLDRRIYFRWASDDPDGDGVSALYQHAAPFGIVARIHPSSDEGVDDKEARFAKIRTDYQNLDFIELPPPDGRSADPKYRQWFEKEDAEDYPKGLLTMIVEGITHFVHVGFHRYFPGYVWDNIWWKWHGVIRYTGGTQEAPIFIRTPLWWCHQQIIQAITGFVGMNLISIAPGVTCYRFNFSSGNPKYIFWVDPVGTKPGSYGNLDTVISTPLPVSIATVAGWASALVTEVVTALDGSNNPIYVTSTVSGAATINATDTPKIATRAS